MDPLIDVVVYGALLIWSILKGAGLGLLIVFPFFMTYALLTASARADRRAEALWEEYRRGRN